jgi:hypothetical protein
MARPTKELRIDRESKAWSLRCMGYTHARIATALGISPRAVGIILDRICKRELARLSHEIQRTAAFQARARQRAPEPVEPDMSGLAEKLAARARAYERRMVEPTERGKSDG